MTDASLCSESDRLPCCATCWRNPSVHPYAVNEYRQSWLLPHVVGGQCLEHVLAEESCRG